LKLKRWDKRNAIYWKDEKSPHLLTPPTWNKDITISIT
jgi:hypothetical protein